MFLDETIFSNEAMLTLIVKKWSTSTATKHRKNALALFIGET
jgi:hypothetical protein